MKEGRKPEYPEKTPDDGLQTTDYVCIPQQSGVDCGNQYS